MRLLNASSAAEALAAAAGRVDTTCGKSGWLSGSGRKWVDALGPIGRAPTSGAHSRPLCGRAPVQISHRTTPKLRAGTCCNGRPNGVSHGRTSWEPADSRHHHSGHASGKVEHSAEQQLSSARPRSAEASNHLPACGNLTSASQVATHELDIEWHLSDTAEIKVRSHPAGTDRIQMVPAARRNHPAPRDSRQSARTKTLSGTASTEAAAEPPGAGGRGATSAAPGLTASERKEAHL